MPLKITREPYIITAAINRPEAMNAVNFRLMERLEDLLGEIEKDEELRLFVLTGTGKSFVSGGDLREFHQLKHADGAKRMSLRMISILERIETLHCWTLAAINGHTYGGGWEIMLSFDFRVATADAKFGFTQGKFYLPPGWGGITKLSQAVGRNLALYWLASQKVVDAGTAYKCGLIQEMTDPFSFEESLERIKKELILNDRSFIEYIKRRDLKHPEDEIDPFSRFWESDEHQKRVDEFLNRKK